MDQKESQINNHKKKKTCLGLKNQEKSLKKTTEAKQIVKRRKEVQRKMKRKILQENSLKSIRKETKDKSYTVLKRRHDLNAL